MGFLYTIFELIGESWLSNSQKVSIRCGVIGKINGGMLPDAFFNISDIAQVELSLHVGNREPCVYVIIYIMMCYKKNPCNSSP